MKHIIEQCNMEFCNARNVMEVDDKTAADIMKRPLQLPCGHTGTRTLIDPQINDLKNLYEGGAFSAPPNSPEVIS